MRFEKHLRNLRPGYDWVPVAAAEADEAAGAAADSSSDGQQQAFHWVRRIIDDDTLKHCNMEPKEVKVRQMCVGDACGCVSVGLCLYQCSSCLRAACIVLPVLLQLSSHHKGPKSEVPCIRLHGVLHVMQHVRLP